MLVHLMFKVDDSGWRIYRAAQILTDGRRYHYRPGDFREGIFVLVSGSIRGDFEVDRRKVAI